MVSSVDYQRILSITIIQSLQYQGQARIDEGQLVLLLNLGGLVGLKELVQILTKLKSCNPVCALARLSQ